MVKDGNKYWGIGDVFDDGMTTQEDEDFCNDRVYCEPEDSNENRTE